MPLQDIQVGQRIHFKAEDYNAWNAAARKAQDRTGKTEPKHLDVDKRYVKVTEAVAVGQPLVLSDTYDSAISYGQVHESLVHDVHRAYLNADTYGGMQDSLIGIVVSGFDGSMGYGIAIVQFSGLVPARVSGTPDGKNNFVSWNGTELEHQYFGRHKVVAKLRDRVPGPEAEPEDNWYLIDVNAFEKSEKEYLIEITGSDAAGTGGDSDRRWEYSFKVLSRRGVDADPSITDADIGKAYNTLEDNNLSGEVEVGVGEDFGAEPLVSNPSVIMHAIRAGAVCKLYVNADDVYFTLPNATFGPCGGA